MTSYGRDTLFVSRSLRLRKKCDSIGQRIKWREKVLIMKEYKLYLFDFDYTLANSEAGIIGCFAHVLEKNGHTGIDPEAIKRTIGLPLMEEFRLLTGIRDEETLERYRSEFTLKANEIMTARTELFPQTFPMLTRLKEKGAKTGIVSTKQRFRIQETIEKYALQELVDFVVGVSDVDEPKPSPQGIFLALSYFSVDKSEALYIGDSIIDAKAGQNAGVDFAAVLTGVTRREEFEEFPCVKTMETFDELL